MFETAELGQKLSKKEYEALLPDLRTNLLRVQYELRENPKFPVILLIAGDDRTGRHDLMNVLHEWMDARYLEGNAFGEPSDEESERPRFWRYWRTLPARGRIGIYVRAWAMRAVVGRLHEGKSQRWLDEVGDEINGFEKTLADDGALILKFWLHLPKSELKQRLKDAARDPDRAWRVHDKDREIYKRYDETRGVMESVLRSTSTPEAPWTIVESTDARFRNYTVGKTLADAMDRRILHTNGIPAVAGALPAVPPSAVGRTVLDTVDLSKTVEKDKYDRKLKRLQGKVHELFHEALHQGVSSVLVFEGWDAAGKGGSIRRLTRALDSQNYRVIPVAAPTQDELAHHYLWRFWQRLPRAGRLAVFDRSWYGRVLVERVEGYAREDEWMRAYAEINEFERQLHQHGTVVVKYWLHISPEEQLRRFKEREKVPFKKYKITEDDYRNRDKWPAYEIAANDMIGRTSTEAARWHLVAANDKRSARLEVIDIYCKALAAALKK